MEDKKLTKKQKKALKFRNKDSKEQEHFENEGENKAISDIKSDSSIEKQESGSEPNLNSNPERKSKKQNKTKSSSKKRDRSSTLTEPESETSTKKPLDSEPNSTADNADEPIGNEEQAGKKQRYIVFVGNLSYSTSAQDVKEFFKAASKYHYHHHQPFPPPNLFFFYIL
ncbi:hypothetical protein AYI68_g1884 [Smittium mucronatum]|uniref:RRM domain-containing protein n=1 Tax=Smittium mucronatum TaxID=133383 RepID=A0A1R0H447_9FUNG|nr:hypothetical protein AYI68_g1884 [Smittium mucronatum]